MYRLNDQQVDFILSDLRQRGIRTESLLDNLLDHICILIEEGLEEGGNFERYYAGILPSFYKEEIKELEEETVLLMTLRKGHLLLSRTGFFLLLFTFLVGPIIAFDLVQVIHASHTPGWSVSFKLWAGPLVFALFPLLTLLVLFLTPEKFDPLIPRQSKVLLGFRPFVRILPLHPAG